MVRKGRGAEEEEGLANVFAATSEPINPTLNETNPGLLLNGQFSISINRLAETDGKTELRAIPIATVSFVREQSENGFNKKSNYTAKLGNGAILSVIVSFSLL